MLIGYLNQRGETSMFYLLFIRTRPISNLSHDLQYFCSGDYSFYVKRYICDNLLQNDCLQALAKDHDLLLFWLLSFIIAYVSFFIGRIFLC